MTQSISAIPQLDDYPELGKHVLHPIALPLKYGNGPHRRRWWAIFRKRVVYRGLDAFGREVVQRYNVGLNFFQRRRNGAEGPTVWNRTVAYFPHYAGAGSRAAVERSKVRSRNRHSDWKRLPVRLDVRTASCFGTRQATAAPPTASVFPALCPPRSEPVYCGKDGRGPDQNTGNPPCPP